MIIIPAVDIKDGKCVRLKQGRLDKETVFAEDPSAVAQKWADAGARLIHVIDLDGAFAKCPQNTVAIQKILERIQVPIQVGGGIRNQETIEKYLNMGVKRVILGTEAVRQAKLVNEACRHFPNQIVLGLDARNGYVAIDGWIHTTRVRAIELAKQFESSGLAAINFTDIHRDGMQSGLNIKEIQSLAEAIDVPVVASGGVSKIDDLRKLLPLESIGVIGVIVGKALYCGTLDFKAASEILGSKR
ncbi:MAG: 1-(5-phosphoribosyl)-5-[(5-phosphoribosylamino)methylideneamino]imidazole-4-carboxamide isomerase [Desulfobacterales bacterium]|nr:MAG: 1-(5-phosphoribosyl)-5-[(5-phosphoribosylamino)methylideneamino]imidazole-4-carboxamide isomerase [Desulfobacterales bacterium]